MLGGVAYEDISGKNAEVSWQHY